MNKKGFTLIEVLVAVLIIGVLAAVAIPGYQKSMEKSRATEAIRALSDISKAQQDYYMANNTYTDNFNAMSIDVFRGASGDEHEATYFTYTLEDERATAHRERGADSYTLYRNYDDVITYCAPESNKYCQMLDLPAGNFGVSACPEGYTCNESTGETNGCASGYYMDLNSGTCGTSCPSGFTCDGDTMTDSGDCENADYSSCIISATYNASGVKTSQLLCLYYSNYCEDAVYLENFNEHGDIISSCPTYDPSYCTYYTYTYDSNGNKLTMLHGEGQYQRFTTYDYSGGTLVSSTERFRNCASSNSDGSCATFQYHEYSTTDDTIFYDAAGNPTSKVRKICATVNSETGECTYNEKENCTLQGGPNGWWNCSTVCGTNNIDPITGDC